MRLKSMFASNAVCFQPRRLAPNVFHEDPLENAGATSVFAVEARVTNPLDSFVT